MAGAENRAIAFSEKIAVAGILLIAALIRLPGLGESLWFDEIYYTNSMFKPPEALLKLFFGDVHPPVYPLVLLGWTRIFGDGEIAVRLPSFLFGMASLVLVWIMGRRWFGRRVAALGLALLSLSPVHVWYSRENKNNMLFLLLCTAAVWFYWKAMERRAPRDWISATLCLILALGTHDFALSVACSIALWIGWRCWEEKRSIKPAFYSALAAGLVLTPVVLLMYVHGSKPGRGYLRPLTVAELYKFLFVWLPHGNTLRTVNPYASFAQLAAQSWIYFLVDGFFAALLIWGLIKIYKTAAATGGITREPSSSSSWVARLILLWLLLPLALTFTASLVFKRFYIERSLLALLSPYVLVLALGACCRRRAFSLVATGLVLLLSAGSIWSLYWIKADNWTVYKPKPDWRSAMNYLGSEVKKDGSVLLITTNPTNEVSYYGPRTIPGYLSSATAQSGFSTMDFCSDKPERILQMIREKNRKSFHILWNETWSGCFAGARDAIGQDAGFRLSETHEWKRLTLYKYDIAGSR
jgi:4-amino-4-deoxy-L-arabinose transferase-like glycosyltransferase